ncbi:MAG: dTMP kinase [Deltaproteobacteria bacterium]|nr:dTMP kinase [Deltaproteobacteria bacterium]
MIEGHFIVLEGIDGSGTTTQTGRLADALRSRGLPAHTTREPSDGPIGMLIRQVLTGRLVVPGSTGGRAPSWSTMACLFAADRLDHLEAEIHPNLRDGVTVISDRYDASSVAYQSISSGLELDASVIDWIRTVNSRARRPDLTLVLDVPVAEANRRRRQRQGRVEIYDDDELQAALARFYTDIDAFFPTDRIVHIDANRSVDEVAADVLRAVEDLRRLG